MVHIVSQLCRNAFSLFWGLLGLSFPVSQTIYVCISSTTITMQVYSEIIPTVLGGAYSQEYTGLHSVYVKHCLKQQFMTTVM